MAEPPGDPRRGLPAGSTSGNFFLDSREHASRARFSVFKKKFPSVDPAGRPRWGLPVARPIRSRHFRPPTGGSNGTARSLGRPRRIALRPRIWTSATTDPRLSRFARPRVRRRLGPNPRASGDPRRGLPRLRAVPTGLCLMLLSPFVLATATPQATSRRSRSARS